MIFKLRYIPSTATEYTEIEVHPYDQRNNAINYEFDETIAEARPKLSKPLVFVNELKEARSEASFFNDTLRDIETEIYIDIYNDANELLMTGYFYGRDIEVFSNGAEYLKVSVKLTTFDNYTPIMLQGDKVLNFQNFVKENIKYRVRSTIEIVDYKSGGGVPPDPLANFWFLKDQITHENILHNPSDILVGIDIYAREKVYMPKTEVPDGEGWILIIENELNDVYVRDWTYNFPDLKTFLNYKLERRIPLFGANKYEVADYNGNGEVCYFVDNSKYADTLYVAGKTYVPFKNYYVHLNSEVYQTAYYKEYEAKNALNLRTFIQETLNRLGVSITVVSNYMFEDGSFDECIERVRESRSVFVANTRDIIRPLAQEGYKLDYTLNDVFSDLYAKHGLKYLINGTTLYLEHEETFDNIEFMDISGSIYINDRQSYKSTNKESQTADEYDEIFYSDEMFGKQKINYESKNMLLSSKVNEKSIKTNILLSDLDGVLRNPDEADEEGLLILGIFLTNTVVYNTDTIQNYSFAPAFTFVNDRKYNRAQSTGVLEYDGAIYNFTSIPIKLRENLTIFDGVKPYRVLGHVKDDFGIGYIKKFEAGFNGLVTLELIYR